MKNGDIVYQSDMTDSKAVVYQCDTVHDGEAVYQYRDLYNEMENYEKHGVNMILDGSQASPMQIVAAHMAREQGCYMRDYIIDPNGYIESLVFVNINNNNQA